MPKTIKGVVKGDVIVPEDAGTLPEGMSVIINLPARSCWLKHVGVWHGRENFEELIGEIYRSRTIPEKDAEP